MVNWPVHLDNKLAVFIWQHVKSVELKLYKFIIIMVIIAIIVIYTCIICISF